MEAGYALKIYYRDIFPLTELFRILEINETREISMYSQQNSYLRYLTFDTVEALKEKIFQITPKKIDLGPFHDIKPTKLNGAIPIAKELVFDIDLTDYPRTCCQDKNICEECYEKIKCAVKLLNYSLKHEFGFKNFGFVFSGRRGLHCWVFDFKGMPNSLRNDIYKYFKYVLDHNLYIREYDEIMREFGDENLIENFFVRIDKQVTVTMHHLIKMPFSVHPETMRISVPLDPNDILDLKDLPFLEQVVANPSIIEPFVRILQKWKT